MPAVRELFLEYEAELGIDLCFQGFRKEVDTLPGAYAAPEGALLVAFDLEGLALGCVALRPAVGTHDCEMKRLYLRRGARGRGAGRTLVTRLIEVAEELGYSGIRLDTLPTMAAAQSIYRSLGFEEIGPYTFNPVERTVFMRKPLRGVGGLDGQ